MSAELTKRALTGLGAAALGLLPSRAKADTPFTSFAFPAAGAPTPRTMPARLGEIKNVRDFGAVGDGVADDTAAIQATINWAPTANRGTIYFPPGRYLVTAPITYNYNGALSIAFRGEQGLSTLLGNFPGFILDRSLSPSDSPSSGGRVIEKLNLINGHAAGGGLRMGSTVGGAIRDLTVSAFRAIMAADADGGASQSIAIENCQCSSGGLSGASGIEVTGNAVISACDLSGFDVAIRTSRTSGVVILAPRLEVNNTGILLGGSTGDPSAQFTAGAVVLGGTYESNGTAIDCHACSYFKIGGLTIQGFEGAIVGNPQYGIRVRSESQFGEFSGLVVSGQFQVASISVEDTTDRGGMTFSGVRANNVSTLGGVAWQLPTKAHTAEFINCDVNPTFLFSGLPIGSNRRTGDKYYITDGNQSTLGGNVTAGGGANSGLVIWNGSNWTLMSK